MAIFPEASNNDLNAFLLIEGNSLCKQDVPGWWWPKAPIYLASCVMFFFCFFCFFLQIAPVYSTIITGRDTWTL